LRIEAPAGLRVPALSEAEVPGHGDYSFTIDPTEGLPIKFEQYQAIVERWADERYLAIVGYRLGEKKGTQTLDFWVRPLVGAEKWRSRRARWISNLKSLPSVVAMSLLVVASICLFFGGVVAAITFAISSILRLFGI
jgi:hypothetical protein